MPTLENAWVVFHTTDDDKDGDTRIDLTVYDERNRECAKLGGEFDHFDDHSINGPYELEIKNASEKEQMTRGRWWLHIDPEGDDEWHFGLELLLLFSDGSTLSGGPEWGSQNLAEDRADARGGLQGLYDEPEGKSDAETRVPSTILSVVKHARNSLVPKVGTFYQVVVKHSGLALNVAGGVKDPGRQVIQWPVSGTDNEKWQFIDIGGGFYNIVVKHSGLALNVGGGTNHRGARVFQWPVWGTDNERWRLVKLGNGFFSIVAKHSNLALNVEGGSNDAGAKVIQWPLSGGGNEQWRLTTT